MPRNKITIGTCPKCGRGEIACSYNRFDGPADRIDSWEHRCGDCGYRETQAFRASDPASAGQKVDECPFCRRSGQLAAV